ncbi:MarR family winged helix-turn-helix transcriptional regulator [Guggenheimella bovis]
MLIPEEFDKRLTIFANLFLVSNKLQSTMDKSLDEITAKQWFVLAALSVMENPPTLKELAKDLDYSHQNIRSILSRLEDKGFIEVTPDEQDQRAVRIHVKEKAFEWEQRNQKNSQYFISEMFKGIDQKEIESVHKTLNKLYNNLGAIYEKI